MADRKLHRVQSDLITRDEPRVHDDTGPGSVKLGSKTGKMPQTGRRPRALVQIT
jgi:hypothetical protein